MPITELLAYNAKTYHTETALVELNSVPGANITSLSRIPTMTATATRSRGRNSICVPTALRIFS